MIPVLKYLAFLGLLAAACYAAANFDLVSIVSSQAAKGGKTPPGSQGFRDPHISGKPSSSLAGFNGQGVIGDTPLGDLTAVASEDAIKVWRLPETTPLQEIDSGAGFQALSLRFIPATNLLVAGGMMGDLTGSVRFFEAVTGNRRLQIDEPEPIVSLDPHPGGRYLLATGETYLKVFDMKDGNTVAVLQKNTPASRGYYYGGGQYVLQSDSLSLFDLKKRSAAGALDTVKPLLFRKGLDGKTFAWVSELGVTVVPAAGGKKRFFPLDTRGVTAFDVAPDGGWGLFLTDQGKMAVIDLAGARTVKSIALAEPASDVTISADGASAYLQYASGAISVYDIGYRNKVKQVQHALSGLFDRVRSKVGPAAKPEPQ